MNAFFTSALRSGMRSRSFQAVFVLGVFLIGGAYLSAMLSPRQPATVALDVGISGLRFSLVLLALFWVQDLISDEIERRTAVFYLAYPITRAGYLLGRLAGIAFLLLIATLVLSLLLWIAIMSSSEMYAQSHRLALGTPYWATIFAVWLSSVVVAAFTLSIATLSTMPALPLALGAAFAIAGQTLGAVVDYLAKGADGQTELVAQYGPIVETIQWVLPDLSRLDWRIWPMYDLPLPIESLGWSIVMALAYIFLMLGIAIPIFNRREFD